MSILDHGGAAVVVCHQFPSIHHWVEGLFPKFQTFGLVAAEILHKHATVLWTWFPWIKHHILGWWQILCISWNDYLESMTEQRYGCSIECGWKTMWTARGRLSAVMRGTQRLVQTIQLSFLSWSISTHHEVGRVSRCLCIAVMLVLVVFTTKCENPHPLTTCETRFKIFLKIFLPGSLSVSVKRNKWCNWWDCRDFLAKMSFS